MKISVIGLGKLGLSMAMAMTHKGLHVVGFDILPRTLDALRKGQSPLDEPFVQEYLTEALQKNRFQVTDQISTAILETDLTLIAVNTPEESPGVMDLGQLTSVCKSVAEVLKEKNSFHVIAINSTVTPETTERALKPICEEVSGKKAGRDFGLCVNPVWIALTTVVQDFTSPPVVVIGASDPKSGNLLEKLYSRICTQKMEILRTTPTMAEFIKMAHNAFATAKMTFVNELADACSRMPQADVRDLTKFFKLGGERAGKFFEAGMGFGGSCFPRDLEFFTNYVKKHINETPLLSAIGEANLEHGRNMVDLMERELDFLRGRRVTVLGLSYKPNSGITERSFSIEMIYLLLAKGAIVTAFDPNITELHLDEPSGRFFLSETLNEALQDSECCIIATPWKDLNALSPGFYNEHMKRSVLFDPWRIYETNRFDAVDRHIPLGLASKDVKTFSY